jgi:methyltransferase (TIGR00027 family)
MLDHVSAGIQVVILGAGWDTRAYGLLKGQGATIFEVDAPATQTVKLAAIDKTGIDASHATFVACDFNHHSWLEALQKHGFDPSQRTIVLWEGVSMYLEDHAIHSTLRAVSNLPTGSRIAFDFLSREWLEETWPGKLARLGVKVTYGEPFTFGLPVRPDFSGQLTNYLEKHGLALDCARPMGDERGGKVPYGGLVLAVTPPFP